MVNACIEAPLLSGRVCTARRTLIPFPDFENKLDRPFFPLPPRSTEGLREISLFFFSPVSRPTGGHARAVAIAPRHARESRMQKHCYYCYWALLATMFRVATT